MINHDADSTFLTAGVCLGLILITAVSPSLAVYLLSGALIGLLIMAYNKLHKESLKERLQREFKTFFK